MSIKIMDMVWNNAKYTDQSTVLVLLALADWSNDEGVSWPSIPKLAIKARMSERNARYVLRNLEKDATLSREVNRGRNHTNRYYLNLVALRPKENLQNLQNGSSTEDETCKPELENLQNETGKPAIAIAPEPSVEPSRAEPSSTESASPKPGDAPEAIRQTVFSDRAIEQFQERYGQKPTWTAKDYKRLFELREARPNLSLDEFQRRYAIMLKAPPGSFTEQKRGSLLHFCTHFDEFIEPIGERSGKLRGSERTRHNINALQQALRMGEERESRSGEATDSSRGGGG